MSACGDRSDIATAKRKRGRTLGSKNKPKFPVATCVPNAPTLQPHVLEIPVGGDVASTIAGFARGCRSYGVCILSASGPIAAAVLWEASPYPTTLLFQGCFNLLSMTATFLPGGSEGSLAVTLAGPQGQVVGGVVAGPVVAAGTVIVVAATFASPAFHYLDAINNTSASMLPVIGGQEGCGKSLPAETCEEGRREHIDGASVSGGSNGVEESERDMCRSCINEIEMFLDLPEAGGDVFSADGFVVGGDSTREEMDGNRLEQRVREMEQCLEMPAAAGGASNVEAEEKKCLDDASVLGGSEGGNMFEAYSLDLPMVDESAFGCGHDGFSEHFAFNQFWAPDFCPTLY